VLALVVYWPVSPFSTRQVVTCGCYDVVEQMWFLAWTPHALVHGLNPFFTAALNVPEGANLATNTTMPLLGILASPITFTLGPVAAYNVLMRLALCASALSMCLVLRHYRLRFTVAFLGGLVFGFSPYMLTQGSLHLNLCFVPLLPIFVVALDNLVVRPAHSARRDGLVLGALATAQYFISSELLADVGVLMAIALLGLALRYPRQAVARLPRLAAGFGWALLPVVVLVGYPFLFGLVGPVHYVKNWQTTNGDEQIKNDLLSPLLPTSAQLLAPSRWSSVANGLVGGAAENGGYLGIPLVACWFASTLWAALRRNGTALLLGITALVAFVLSLGPLLQVHGRLTGVHLPFSLAAHVPLLELAVAARYSVLVVLCVVVCVGFAFDALWSGVEPATASRGAPALPGASSPAPPASARPLNLPATVGAALLVVVTLLPLLPSRPIAHAAVKVPRLFRTGAVQSIPPGSNLLVYPYPIEQDDYSMLWQAEAGFRFQLLGGYVLTPLQTDPPSGAGPGGADTPQTLDPPIVQILFEEANAGSPVTVPPKPWATRQIEEFLRRYAVSTVVVDTDHDPAPPGSGGLPPGISTANGEPGAVARVFRAMFGKPVRSGPLLIWYDASTRPVRRGYR
jgi:hypothetical protein